MIEESSLYNVRTVTLSNESFAVRILPGKGGDINQIWWKPREVSLLHVREENFCRFQDRNLYVSPLKHRMRYHSRYCPHQRPSSE